VLASYSDKAIDTCKQALQSNPKHTRALFNLTTAYAKENQWDLAKQACNTLAQIDPQTAAKLSQSFPNAASVPAPSSPPAQSSSPAPLNSLQK
jgi:tetratricopeptide (TPR) repeat protein